MDSRGNMMPSVETIKPEAPSSYQLALRTDDNNHNQTANHTQTMGPPGFSPASGGMPSSLARKKRGRPRKYGPDGVATAASGGGSGRTLSPLPLSSASSPTSGGYSDVKFGEPAGSGGELQTEKKKRKKMSSLEKSNTSLGDQITSGGSFTPHMVTVNAGEDVTSKIISFSKYGPRAICVLSALGIISHVTLRQGSSSGGTVTYEGRFEILSLSGSFTPGEVEGLSSREGGMSIALSSPDGRVVGGVLGGLLTAAGPVQVVVASFLPELGGPPVGPKPKKQKSIMMADPNMEQNLSEQRQESPVIGNDESTPTPTPNFQHENRTSMPTVRDWSRNSMNLNEQRHMQESDNSTPPPNFLYEKRTSTPTVHEWSRTSMNLNEQKQREESHVGGNDGSTPAPNFQHERTSVPSVHDWSRTSMNLNEQRKRQESPVGENDGTAPVPNFRHERTSVPSVHDWSRTSMNLNEHRKRQESPMGENDGCTPTPNFQPERTSVPNVHDWRRAVTDMNVSFRED